MTLGRYVIYFNSNCINDIIFGWKMKFTNNLILILFHLEMLNNCAILCVT